VIATGECSVNHICEIFISHLSVLNLLFNEGPASLAIIRPDSKC
jgi:hypothetical protein